MWDARFLSHSLIAFAASSVSHEQQSVIRRRRHGPCDSPKEESLHTCNSIAHAERRYLRFRRPGHIYAHLNPDCSPARGYPAVLQSRSLILCRWILHLKLPESREVNIDFTCMYLGFKSGYKGQSCLCDLGYGQVLAANGSKGLSSAPRAPRARWPMAQGSI